MERPSLPPTTHACTRTLVCSVVHASAPPALVLTPPNLCVREGVADLSFSPAAVQGYAGHLAYLQTPPGGRGGAAACAGVAPALLLGWLSPRSESRRTKVSGGRPRDTPISVGRVPLHPANTPRCQAGLAREARSHPPDSQEP